MNARRNRWSRTAGKAIRIRPIVALLAAVGLTAGLAGFPEAGAQPAPVGRPCAPRRVRRRSDSVIVPIWGYAAGPSATAGAPASPGTGDRVTEGDTASLALELHGLGPDAMPSRCRSSFPTSAAYPTPSAWAGRDERRTVSPRPTWRRAPTSTRAGSTRHPGPDGPARRAVVALGRRRHGVRGRYGTDFDVESMLTFSAIWTSTSTRWTTRTTSAQHYAPDYFLINGAATPTPPRSPPSRRRGAAALRQRRDPAPLDGVLGVHQRVVGRESHRLVGTTAHRRGRAAGGGAGGRQHLHRPPGRAPGTGSPWRPQRPHDQQSRAGGGMLTFIEAEAAPPLPDLPLSLAAPGTAGVDHLRRRGRGRHRRQRLLAHIRRVAARAWPATPTSTPSTSSARVTTSCRSTGHGTAVPGVGTSTTPTSSSSTPARTRCSSTAPTSGSPPTPRTSTRSNRSTPTRCWSPPTGRRP